MKKLLVCIGALVISAGTLHSGCFEGGASFNMKAPGNNDSGGINLSGKKDGSGTARKDVAVDPHGTFLLARMGSSLVMGKLGTGKVYPFDKIGAPNRVAFANKAKRFYVTAEENAPMGIFGVNATTRKVIWKRGADGFTRDLRLYPSRDDKFLVLADGSKLEVVDAADGSFITSYHPAEGIQDLDITPDSSKLVVTQNFKQSRGGEVNTNVLLITPDGEKVTEISVPNCSSPLVVSPDGKRGFLAPTQCGNDPVSVIDLEQGKFMRNLPGFGPVAMSPDGSAAVAFMDADFLDKTLFDDKSQIPSRKSDRYHLMIIDPISLKFTTVELGDDLPRYAISRDGKVVLVDSVWMGTKEQVRLVDVKTRSIQTLPVAIYLDHFVMSPNHEDVYLLSSDLLQHLNLPKAKVRSLNISKSCQSLNMTLDGKSLLVMDWQDQVHMVDTTKEKITRTLKLNSGAKGDQ